MTEAGFGSERTALSPEVSAIYYITKGQKTVGPCSLDDLRAYIAYGSVRDSDLVRREGATEWTPLRYLAELQLNGEDAPTAQEITTRRRTARYRDYEKVPIARRSGVVLGWLVWGFLVFPPLLWRGAISVYQDRIYSQKADEKGYLQFWPRWIEPIVTVLLVVNAITWLLLIAWVWRESTPMARELASFVSTAIIDLQNWLSK